jgi:bile acid:Na+ symporter, BASS family
LLRTSVVLMVFAFALEAAPRDLAFLFRHPAQLIRTLIAMNVVAPLLAAALVALFSPQPVIAVALVALSISPVPPILPKKETKAGGDRGYALATLFLVAVLSIAFLPLAANLFGRVFQRAATVSISEVAMLVAITVVAPLVAGVAVAWVAPRLAARVARPLGLIAFVLLALCVLPVLFLERHAMLALVGDGTLLIFVAFNVIALAIGHALGGSVPRERTVLALSTATRHPGIAFAIAAANLPDKRQALAAIGLYLLVNAIVSGAYLFWRRRATQSGRSLA